MAQVKLDRWIPHLDAAKTQGMTLADYAREHGLSRHTLYCANLELRRLNQTSPQKRVKRSKGEPRKNASGFIPVELAPVNLLTVHVSLPNGIELRCESMNVDSCTALVHTLGAL